MNTTWTTGRYGRALAFNGSNSWVTVNSSASLNLVNRLTLEAWVLPTINSGWRAIMLKELDAIYELYASSSSGPVGGVNIGGYQEVFSSTSLPTNTWSHVSYDVGWDNLAPVCQRGADGQSGGGGHAVDDDQSVTDRGRCEVGRILRGHDR